MIWGALAFAAISIILALVFHRHQSALSRRVGRLEAEAESLRGSISWLHVRAQIAARPPMSGPDSVERLERLSDNGSSN